MYLSVEDLNKKPPCNPNPTDVGVISIISSQPQSEHFPPNANIDTFGLAPNFLFLWCGYVNILSFIVEKMFFIGI